MPARAFLRFLVPVPCSVPQPLWLTDTHTHARTHTHTYTHKDNGTLLCWVAATFLPWYQYISWFPRSAICHGRRDVQWLSCGPAGEWRARRVQGMEVAELADDGSQPDHPDGESARALVVVPQTLHVSGRKRLGVPCHGLFISLESRCFSARRIWGPLEPFARKSLAPFHCSAAHLPAHRSLRTPSYCVYHGRQ